MNRAIFLIYIITQIYLAHASNTDIEKFRQKLAELKHDYESNFDSRSWEEKLRDLDLEFRPSQSIGG